MDQYLILKLDNKYNGYDDDDAHFKSKETGLSD